MAKPKTMASVNAAKRIVDHWVRNVVFIPNCPFKLKADDEIIENGWADDTGRFYDPYGRKSFKVYSINQAGLKAAGYRLLIAKAKAR